MAFIVNTTAKEYFVNYGEQSTSMILKELLTPNTCNAKTALTPEDTNESRWKRTDAIKYISSPVLMTYVHGQFSRIYIEY
jgi:hypothetical protein